ncbi:MAG: dicarboxylate/amino acid:cation symporter [Marinilabiliaceae bacterium]|nr:dicarboxylate/amino acid:cation symporter [Marinilabiliaceae bacterium]
MKKIPLYLKIIIGLFVGIIWAFLSGYLGWSNFTTIWIAPFGRIFINLLKLAAVPLVFFSIIGAIIRLGNPANLGKLGGKTLLLYLTTYIMAISVGLILVNLIKPGKQIQEVARIENRLSYELWLKSENLSPNDGRWYSDEFQYEKLLDEVMKRQGLEKTEEIQEKVQSAKENQQRTPLSYLEELVPINIFNALQNNGAILQIIFFAIMFGVSGLFLPTEKSESLTRGVDIVTDTLIKMIDLIMKAAPFFVFALMAGMINEIAGDNPAKILELFKGLSWYALTVFGGLIFLAFIFYPFLIKIFIKKISPKQFLKGIFPAQILAFSTSSSSATLPVTLECAEQNLKIDKKIARFVIPTGATINMDGTSLYQAVAVLFLAQLHLIDLTIAQQLTVMFTVTMASIGAAPIPGAGIIILMIVLSSVGLNPAWVAIILPVDRILDMVRTIVNVTGDITVAFLVDRKSV